MFLWHQHLNARLRRHGLMFRCHRLMLFHSFCSKSEEKHCVMCFYVKFFVQLKKAMVGMFALVETLLKLFVACEMPRKEKKCIEQIVLDDLMRATRLVAKNFSSTSWRDESTFWYRPLSGRFFSHPPALYLHLLCHCPKFW